MVGNLVEMISDAVVHTIREHEMRAVRVEIDPVFGDIILNLPDRSGMSVPKHVWDEYCRRVRPVFAVSFIHNCNG